MKGSILIQPYLNPKLVPEKIRYTTRPYDIAKGVTRAFQRFAAIALTSVGTDALRPWLGTELPMLCHMNMHDRGAFKLTISDELHKAIDQFFILQKQETPTTAVDIIKRIQIVSIEIDDDNRVSARLRFYPASSEAVELSLEVK